MANSKLTEIHSQTIRSRQEAYTSALSLLRQLIAVPSVSRDEAHAADLLEAWPHVTFRRQGNNLWAIAPGYDAARPTLLLCAHIDTVKPVASWTREPFTPTEEPCVGPGGEADVRLYGLGANDDGASLVSLLHVFVLLCARPQAYNIVFVAAAEEEVSGRGGIESVLPLLPPVDVALVGEPTGMRAAVAEKGLVVLDGTAYGRSGHAARDEGVNAIYRAIEAIERLRGVHFDRVSETLGPVRVNVTQVSAGTAHNVVPDRCAFVVDVRTTDAYTNEETVDLLRRAAIGADVAPTDAALTLIPRSTRLQPSSIAPTHPLVQRIVALGCPLFGSPTLSDQALLPCPSLKMGPGDSARSHTADEYILHSEIRHAIDLYLDVLDGLQLTK